MSQTAMTIRLEEETKKEFSKLCAEFGLSVNAAINVFIKAVINSGEIPFRIGRKSNDRITANALASWASIRQHAEQSTSAELTLDEINEEIRLAREEREKKIAL